MNRQTVCSVKWVYKQAFSMPYNIPEDTMKIAVEFYGVQRTYTNTSGIEMPINGHTTVNDVVEYVRRSYPGLPVDDGMVHIIVNQKIASLDTVLAANDTVAFLPTIHGG